ncbi:MAG: LysM peptidoglycan-binding domain-containing protein, partial [Candidatus Binatia bacterium]
AMQERVRFWVRIFTQVSHTEVVLHDRDDLRVVYDVVPLGAAGNGGPVDAARATYGRMLASMAVEDLSPPRLLVPAPERLRVRALFDRCGPRGYVRAIGNIRAQRGLKEIFADSLVRSELYLPTIRRIFRETGLPAELVYIPHVESSFNPNAVSRAGAAGLWQFTRDTADAHLKIGGAVDERFDPVRSSAAAATHLARARSVLGSWPLAVASYNHGVAGIARARAAIGSDSLDDIIRGYEGASFGFASRNFYAEFLAAAHVAQHTAYYFPDLKREPILHYVVRPGDSLWKIARQHRVTVRALVAANNLGRTPLQQGQRLMIRL